MPRFWKLGTLALASASLNPVIAHAQQDRPQPPECVAMRSLRAQGKVLEAHKAQRACIEASRRQSGTPAVARPQSPVMLAPAPAAPAPAPAPGPASAAPGAEAWVAQLPTVATVQAKTGLDAARRDAAFEVLKDYMAKKVGRHIDGSGQGVSPLVAQRWREYRAAQSVRRVGNAIIADSLSDEARRHFVSADFRQRTLAGMVSPQAAAEYAYRSEHAPVPDGKSPMQSQPQPSVDAAVALKQRIDADKRPGVDRKVFGVELGQPLQFPQCQNGNMTGSELFSGLAGVGKGAATTCVGDQMLGMAMGFTQLAMKATGLNSPQSATQQVPVKLADTQCPDWLRLGGSCSIIVSVKEGYMLGATMVPTSHAELLPKIAKQLTTKYGKPSEKSALTSCINNLTGMVTDQAPELRWKLPGLYVTYTPLVSDCKRGRIVVELATLHQMATEQQAAHEAAEPSM